MSDATAGAASQRVVACVIRRADGYLVCQRPPHKRHGGLWEFPGGKAEPNESDEHAAARELREELDVELTATAPAIFETRDPAAPYVIAFVPVEIRGEPKCIEHSAMACGSPEALLALPLVPSDRAFIEFLMPQDAKMIDG
ncbi:MAG TPA: NUDIX domain-containing protein [Gemmatimonadaceae bacterium]|nr:NUDIX domain-containing protein [Gemmatimonadaceae bacterium]